MLRGATGGRCSACGIGSDVRPRVDASLRQGGHTGAVRRDPGHLPPRMSRIFTTSVGSVYPHYVAKGEKKGRTKAELDEAIEWLTGYDQPTLAARLDDGTTFEDFFAGASLNPNAPLITGVVCGVRVEEVEDPLMQRIRYLDKLVDELA